jgi:hypothetical protein
LVNRSFLQQIPQEDIFLLEAFILAITEYYDFPTGQQEKMKNTEWKDNAKPDFSNSKNSKKSCFAS